MTRSLKQARRGFTLVEVLVVISILAIIMGIGVGAYFLIMGGQQKSASEATVSKVDNKLLAKIKLIRDRIKDDTRNNRPGTGVPELRTAGFSVEAAESIMLYCRMRNELPMSYIEALTPTVVPIINLTLPVRSEFQSIPRPNPPFTTPPASVFVPPDYRLQSAVCLFRALSPSNPEGFEQQTGVLGIVPDINGADLLATNPSVNEKVYRDSLGKPLIFNRLAYVGDQGELDTPTTAYDPFFTKKTGGAFLNMATTSPIFNSPPYPNTQPNNFNVAVWAPMNILVPAWAVSPALTTSRTIYPGLRNQTSCVISWGQEGQDATVPSTIYANGNIVSYRLRKEGAKGD